MGRNSAPVEEVIDAACAMVESGIPCVAVKPGVKEPVPNSENGWLVVDDEGRIEETLRKAYETHGGLNLAIATGQQFGSPVVVVDVNDKAGGRLARSIGFDANHDCWIQITGSGHFAAIYYCRETTGLKKRVHAGKMGLDLIVGGYQLIPPSITKGQYHWKPGHSPSDIPFSRLQDLPDSILSWWQTESGVSDDSSERRVSAASLIGQTISPGARNDTFYKIACYLFRKNLSTFEVEEFLHSYNLTHANPPLDRSEIKTICRSASRYSRTASRHTMVEVEV